MAQWEEMMRAQEQKISRPRQVYTGARGRAFVPPHARG
jgi:citrate synthase